MKGFELEPGTFFMCTEASPRCFVIQQVNDVDNALKGVQTNSGNTGSEQADGKKDSGPPSLPMLPWWFTNECKQQLLNIPSFEAAATGIERVSTPDPNLQMNAEQVKARLKSQLEYYFSRENLINDRYLRCQMDADQFVPIKIVAGFPKIAQLTTDFNLIVQILKASEHVQVDETGEKVRPNSKRCTIILREIPESADESEVKSMFDDCPQKYQSIIYGLNGSWYITFATEEDTRLAFIHLQNLGKTFNDKPVHARIKTGGAPVTTTESTNGQIIIHDQYIGKSICESMDYSSPKMDTLNSYNLGLILAQFGYVPRCTFRPTQPSMKDGNGGNVSVNVPISIHTDWHNGSEIDHQLSSGTHLPTNISADHIIGDHGTKENVQPSNHYSITTTSTTTNTAKKLILDSSATKGAGLVQQSAYDGFLLTNTPVSNYGMIPNFGRQRITDVPRMNNKNGRKSPLIYASPIMYTTTNNNNNNYYFNNNNINPNFYKTEENTYHKRNYSTSSSNENRRFDSNRNKETAESNTYPSNRQNNNYNNHYSNTRNYPNNHSSAGFSDNSNTKPYRHRNSNYQQDRFQPVNNGCGDYNSAAPVKQPVLQPLTQQNINKASEGRNQGQAWKPAQYSRQSSHSSYKGYSRQNSDANTNTNWRKATTTRASLDNDNTDSKAIKHNSSGKPIGVAKPLSSTVRVTGTNTAGLQSLIRSSDKMSDSEQYQPSDKKSEDIRSFYPNNSKQDKSTQPNDHDPKKRIECLEEQEYNFVEVEFPSLVEGVDENSKKSSSSTPPQSILQKNFTVEKSADAETQEVSDMPHKQVNNPVIALEHKVQFSAIVAGIKMPKQQSVSTVFPPDDVGLCASGASKCSYAQTLKKHASK